MNRSSLFARNGEGSDVTYSANLDCKIKENIQNSTIETICKNIFRVSNLTVGKFYKTNLITMAKILSGTELAK